MPTKTGRFICFGAFGSFQFPALTGSSNGVKESGDPEFRSRRMDPALLVCEGSPSTPQNESHQLLELSNKRATGDIVIRKLLVINVLRK